MGLKLKHMHRMLKLNTNMRAKAQNDFEKAFYKLMNNTFWGKTMENIRKRFDIEL